MVPNEHRIISDDSSCDVFCDSSGGVVLGSIRLLAVLSLLLHVGISAGASAAITTLLASFDKQVRYSIAAQLVSPPLLNEVGHSLTCPQTFLPSPLTMSNEKGSRILWCLAVGKILEVDWK